MFFCIYAVYYTKTNSRDIVTECIKFGFSFVNWTKRKWL